MALNRTTVTISLLLLFAILPATPLFAAYSHIPSLEWHTLHSPHFHLHYHTGLEEMAHQTLALAEEVHDRLSQQLNWTPAEPVNIVLSDEIDFSNGMASPLPSNWMMLYASPPDDLLGLEDHAGWMELLLIHEYTHILHLDKASRVPAALRRVVGRIPLLFPNLFQPRWLIEGYATYLETDHDRQVGRGQSSLFDAMMRLEVKNGVKPLRQINQPLATWPGGSAAYLYGVYFFQFLAEVYGPASIDQLIHHYSDNTLPFAINNNAEKVYGKDLNTLWEEFSNWLNNKYQAQLNEIVKDGVSEGVRLTHHGYLISSLRVLPDGRIFYISYDGEQHARMMMIDERGRQQELREVNYGARLDVHPSAGILIIQPERCHNAAVYFDLYQTDLEGNDLRRLTRCGRYRNASWSADGNSIYGIQIRAGVNELHQLNKNGVKQSVLWRGAVWEVISSLDVSPDGNNLVAALWRKPDGWNLELFSLESFTWRKLTHDSAIEGHPQYSADGQGIIYTSDQNHAFNLHHLDLRTGRSTILSNVRGSALAPHETVSGNIVYLGYSAEGQDIWQLSGSDRINRPVPSLPPGPSGKALFDTPGPVQAEKQPYSAWNSLRPRMWLPWYFFDDQRSELGFSTSGYDSLLRHFYSTTLAYDASNHWPAGYFSYTYDGWYPLFKFQAERTHRFYEITGDVTGRIRRDDNREMEIAFPFLTMDQRFSVNLGFFTHKNSDVWLDQGVLPIASFTDNVAGLALIYDSSERHIKSISRTSGREIRLLWEDSDALPASNYDGRVRLAEWREFLSLGGEQVLALRLVEGKGSESTRPFRLGGTSDGFSGNGNPLNPFGPSVFNQRRFNLRGYPEGLAALTGQHMRLGSVEYRLPVARIERGFMSPPLGIHQIHATFFYDKGAAWSNRGGPENYYSSSGIEFNADTVFFYSLTMQLAMGYANGREPGGDEKWYLRIGAAF